MNQQSFLTKDEGPAAETILEVGAEGGSLSIRRTRGSGGEWRFTVLRNEDTLASFLHEEDRQELSFSDESDSVDSVTAALALMSRYIWHRLVPLKLHAEYANEIMAEVLRRGGTTEERRWRSALARRSADREPPPAD
jgi:hypothetical protein